MVVGRRAVVAAIVAAGGATVAATVTGRRSRPGGVGGAGGTTSGPPTPAPGRLLARPQKPGGPPPPPGLHPLRLASPRDGMLFVPPGHRAGVASPLVVALHGAGGDAAGGLAPWRELAEVAGLVVVASESRGATWDVIQGGYGPDVAFLDRTLAMVFASLRVDRGRLAIAGFSDGASYALSIGLGNGDLFTHCIAFSPGFVAEPARRGRVRAFVTHGLNDTVLPIDRCSRRIVPALRRDGYDVDYREFDGGHGVPPDQARDAVGWLTAA